jgi:hypothetical protein
MAEATYRGTIYPWQCDYIGHMNIMTRCATLRTPAA